MPIPNVTVSPATFEALQSNITAQSNQFTNAASLAHSGLDIVLVIDVEAPEIDLLSPFANHFLNLESFNSTSQFTQVVTSLNLHVINRGTVANVGETLSSRLNRWLSSNGVTVTQVYANISSGAGFIVDPANISG